MVHNGSEQCRPGGQYCGWALGQSRETRRKFLVKSRLLNSTFAIHVRRTRHHPFRGHRLIAPTDTSHRLISFCRETVFFDEESDFQRGNALVHRRWCAKVAGGMRHDESTELDCKLVGIATNTST